MLFGRFYCKKALSRGRCGGATPALGVAEKTGGRARGLWSAGGRPLLIFFVSFCRNMLTNKNLRAILFLLVETCVRPLAAGVL